MRGEIAFSNQDALMKFAENAVATLSSRFSTVCCEGTIRVDIMQGNDGLTIINEFESLEACIWSSSGCFSNESVAMSYQSTINF